MRYDNKWADRRSGSGRLKPAFFLLLEIVFCLLIVGGVYLLNMPTLTFLTLFAALYFFITSCITRYFKVLKRQKYSHYDQENQPNIKK